MRIGVVFSQADAWMPLVLPGLDLDDLSIGFNRMGHPGCTHAEHLGAAIDAKAVVDRMTSG